MSKNYKALAELYWTATELEKSNPEEAKLIFSQIEEIESKEYRRK